MKTDLKWYPDRLLFLSVFIFLSCLFSLWPISGFGHPAGDLYDQATKAIQGKNLQQAETLLQQAITAFPSYADAHYLLGMVQYQQTQDANTAIPALKQAVHFNPNFAQAHYDLGLLFLSQKKNHEAQESLQQALTIYPGFWEARLTFAKLLDQGGATDQAIQEYETVLEQEPQAPDALYQLAYHSMQDHNNSRAQELLTRLTTNDLQHLDGWYALGRLYEKEQQTDAAIEAYQHVLNIKPNHVDAHYNLGFLYQQHDQPQEAIEHFQQVTVLQPTDAEAYFNLGVLFTIQQQFDQAEEAYHKGLNLKPNSVEGQFNMGAFYEFHKEDLQKATHHYKQYLDLGGQDSRIKQLLQEQQKF